MKNYPLLSQLKVRKNVAITLVASVVLFSINYYVMANLPGEKNLACVMGAGLTIDNILFSVFLSLASGLMLSGFVEMFAKERSRRGVAMASFSGVGFLMGMLTVFCTLCTLPVLSVFGLSVGLAVFTDYDLVFKVISGILMVLSMYWLNRQLKGECVRCVE